MATRRLAERQMPKFDEVTQKMSNFVLNIEFVIWLLDFQYSGPNARVIYSHLTGL